MNIQLKKLKKFYFPLRSDSVMANSTYGHGNIKDQLRKCWQKDFDWTLLPDNISKVHSHCFTISFLFTRIQTTFKHIFNPFSTSGCNAIRKLLTVPALAALTFKHIFNTFFKFIGLQYYKDLAYCSRIYCIDCLSRLFSLAISNKFFFKFLGLQCHSELA